MQCNEINQRFVLLYFSNIICIKNTGTFNQKQYTNSFYALRNPKLFFLSLQCSQLHFYNRTGERNEYKQHSIRVRRKSRTESNR